MATGVYDISIYQGDTFSLVAFARDDDGNYLNLSGYSGFAGIKSNYCSTGYLGVFDVSIPVPLSGKIIMSMPHTGTAALPSTLGFYDLEIARDSSVIKYLKGKVMIYPQISNTFP